MNQCQPRAGVSQNGRSAWVKASLVEAGTVPVAGHVLRLIPQPFHRVEFRTVRRQRQQMNPCGQRRIPRPGMKARLIPDDDVLRLGKR